MKSPPQGPTGTPTGSGMTMDETSTAMVVVRLQRVLHDLRDVQSIEAVFAFAVGLAFILVPIAVYEELPSPGQVPGVLLILAVALTFGVAVAAALMGLATRDWIRLRREEQELNVLGPLTSKEFAGWSRPRLAGWMQALLGRRDGIVLLGFVLGTAAIPLLFVPVLVPGAPWSSPFSWLALAGVFVVPEVALPTLGYALVRPWVARASDEISRLREETDPLDWFVPPARDARGGGRPAAPAPPSSPGPQAIDARLRALRARLAKGVRRQMLAVVLGSVVLAAFPIAVAVGTLLYWSSLGGLPSGFPTAIFVLALGMPLGALLVGVGSVLRANWVATRESLPEKVPGGPNGAPSSATRSELRAVFGLVEQGRRLQPWLIMIAGIAGAFSTGILLQIAVVRSGWYVGSSGAFVVVLVFGLVAAAGLASALVARALATWRYRALATPSKGLEDDLARLEEEFWSRF